MKKSFLVLTSVFALLLLGCVEQPSVGNTSAGSSGDMSTMQLSGDDFELAAETMINSLLSDPAFANVPAGVRKVVAIGRVKNDTALRIDTEKLTAKITRAMRQSGKFVLTTAVAADGALDSMSKDVRELRDDDEFNQKTIAKKGTMVAPDFSLSGKIRQDNIQVGGKTRVEYFFLLRLTDLNSGLAYWEDEKEIKKLGSSKSVSW